MNNRLVRLLISAMITGYTLFGLANNPLAPISPFSAASSSVLQNMVANSSQNLAYTLTTSLPASSGAVNIHCSFTSNSPYLTASFNNNGCTTTGGVGINASLPATVNLTLSTAANAEGLMTGKLVFSQTNGRSPSQTFNIPITIQAPNRIITFKNYCPFSVWFGASSSAVPAKNIGNIACTTNADCSAYTFSQCVNGACGGGACLDDSDCTNSHAGTCSIPAGTPAGTSAACTYCAADSDCLTGAKCNTTNHQCFWQIPTPADAATNHYELHSPSSCNSSSDTITLTDYSSQNGYSLLWSGGFAGRTGCTFSGNTLTCKTAGCNTNGSGDNNGGCNLGEGFAAPSTLAETTFVSTTPDTYDISLINGLNVPTAIYPTPGSAATPGAYNNPFNCGKAGNPENSTTNAGTLGACSWDFTPPSVAFRWVDTDNNTLCSADSTCELIDAAYRCGLTESSVTTGSGSSSTTCGSPLGYWNQNEICAKNTSFNQAGIVDCTMTNIGNTGNSLINLLKCTGNAAVSCYNETSVNSTCCGCTNWQDQGITMPSNPAIVAQCTYPNTYWGTGSTPSVYGNVLPDLIWLKQACPSAYVYPYDDKASTFTCPENNSQSAVNYTVEFCPPTPLQEPLIHTCVAH